MVQPSVKGKLSPGGPVNLRNVKISAPNMASGTEPAKITKGSRNELNWAARAKKMSASASPIAGRKRPDSSRNCRDSPV
ncbi:hypothetical protein D3C83_176890 [compost metagenome]